jgi:hypothetical protein
VVRVRQPPETLPHYALDSGGKFAVLCVSDLLELLLPDVWQ